IIEGLPTFCLGIATWFLLADNPETAYYLTPAEKALMTARRARQLGQTDSAQEMHKADVVLGLRDWKVWAFCAAQFGTDTMLYGYSTFLPTIIASIGHWSTAQVQALTIPCYCLGAVTYLAVARVSDTQQLRGVYCVIFGAISVVGYGILLAAARPGVHYFGCFVVALGLYVAVGLPLAWLPSNQPRYGKRTTATGLQLMVANCSGIMAPFLYKTTESPRYVKGHAVTLAMVGFASCVYGFMSWYFARENRRRKEGKEDGKIVGMTEEDIAEMGDRNPRYIYTT
ncbi:MAG: hypothetical protein LQ347_002539, partial [Umbilicaria vellea]